MDRVSAFAAPPVVVVVARNVFVERHVAGVVVGHEEVAQEVAVVEVGHPLTLGSAPGS